MKAFGLGASSLSLYKMGSKWAPAAMTPFTEDEKISKGPGPLKNWTRSATSRHRINRDSETGLRTEKQVNARRRSSDDKGNHSESRELFKPNRIQP
ncbi:hypothetical protein P5659_21975 [Bacillus subtilis]